MLASSSSKKKVSKFLLREQNFKVSVTSSKNYSLVIYIRSAPTEWALREAVRETWIAEAKRLRITTLFVMALPASWENSLALHQELMNYGDLLIFTDFIDHYHKLSLKTRNILRWHVENTPRHVPDILLLTSIDTIVYPENLLAFIDENGVGQKQGTIYGDCSCHGRCRYNGPPPQRGVNDKWYMPYEVWNNKFYPNHCVGYAILLSPKTCQPLLNSLADFPPNYAQDMWIDDVLFTGILARHANMTLLRYAEHFFADAGPRIRNCSVCVAVHSHGATDGLIRTLWSDTMT